MFIVEKPVFKLRLYRQWKKITYIFLSKDVLYFPA